MIQLSLKCKHMMALHCNIIISMILSADNFTLNKVDQGDSENKLNYVRYLNEMSYKNKEHEKTIVHGEFNMKDQYLGLQRLGHDHKLCKAVLQHSQNLNFNK